MAKHVQSKDLKHTWNIDTSNDTWILAESAKITVSGEPALYVATGKSGNTIQINGDIEGSGTNYVLDIEASSTVIDIGAEAKITATAATGAILAVFMNSNGGTFHNAGVISSDFSCLFSFGNAEITNDGTIRGLTGVAGADNTSLINSGKVLGKTGAVALYADGGNLANLETGIIKSEGIGVQFSGEGDYKVKNDGLISGASALLDENGAGRIVNRGTIEGDVYLGTYQDSFDTRDGIVHGKIFGGEGDDIFFVNSQSLKIVEKENEGVDRVRSTVDYVLRDNFDDLRLLGKKDIDANGNTIDNELFGNAGKNVLRGVDGDDYLDGSKGDDKMFGGGAVDTFVFNKGTGHDVIADFFDGVDVISSDFAGSKADAEALLATHVTVSGKDLLITVDDDSLLIKNMAKDDLTATDFGYA